MAYSSSLKRILFIISWFFSKLYFVNKFNKIFAIWFFFLENVLTIKIFNPRVSFFRNFLFSFCYFSKKAKKKTNFIFPNLIKNFGKRSNFSPSFYFIFFQTCLINSMLSSKLQKSSSPLICLFAGSPSADVRGAQFMESMRKQTNNSVNFIGLGG